MASISIKRTKPKIMTKGSNLKFKGPTNIINNPKSLYGMLPKFDRQGEMMHYRGHPRLLRLNLMIP